MEEKTYDPKDGALPVSGYKPQTESKVALVNEFKADEERILRKLDAMAAANNDALHNGEPPPYEGRWFAIGRTALEQAFMAINRSIFQPGRVELPEDEFDPL